MSTRRLLWLVGIAGVALGVGVSVVLATSSYGDQPGGTEYDEDTNLPIETTPNPNYGNISVYQSPRQVRLGLDIEF